MNPTERKRTNNAAQVISEESNAAVHRQTKKIFFFFLQCGKIPGTQNVTTTHSVRLLCKPPPKKEEKNLISSMAKCTSIAGYFRAIL